MPEKGRDDASKQSYNHDVADYHRAASIRRVALTGLAGASAFMLFSLLLYWRIGAWQMLGTAAGALVALILMALGLLFARRERFGIASYLLISAVVLAYGVTALVYDNADWYLGVGGVVLIIFVSSLVAPRGWIIGGVLAGLFAVYVWLIWWLEPLPRYDVTRSVFLIVVVIGIAILSVLGAAGQVIRYFLARTIRVRLLVIFVLMALLPSVVISVSSGIVGIRGGRNQALDQLEAVATLKEAEIEAWIDSLQNDLAAVLQERLLLILMEPLLLGIQTSEAEEAYVALRDVFYQRVEGIQLFDELSLMNTQARIIVSTDAAQEGEFRSLDLYFFKGLTAPHTELLSDEEGQYSIIAVRPVFSEQGETLGVLAGRVDLDELRKIMRERAGLGTTGETYLVDSDYNLLTELRSAQQEVTPIQTAGIEAVVENQSRVSGLYDDYAETPVIGVYHWLPRLEVVLVAEQDQAEAFRNTYISLIINVGVAIGAVLIAAIAALLVSQNIANPLSDLVQTAERIAAGELELTARVGREDEIGVLARSFNSMTAQLRNLISGLEGRVAERTARLEQRAEQMQAVAEVSRTAGEVLDIDELLDTVANVTRERFELYYVGIFLVDEARQYAWLRAGTGDAGREMLGRQHRLAVEDTSMIGWCVNHNEARIALDVGEDAVRFSNPSLPLTRSEMALPLRTRGEVIGAVTVQSVEPEAFSDEDVLVLQTMADQVANAIANVQLYEQAQDRLRELTEVQERYLREEWSEYLQKRPVIHQEVARHSEATWGDAALSLAVRTIKRGEATINKTADGVELSAPILLGGQVIGAVGLKETSTQRGWSEQDVARVEAIAEQMALALENVRLFEETQRRAARERLVGDVTARMRETLDIDAVLKTVVREIGERLEIPEVEVRIGEV